MKDAILSIKEIENNFFRSKTIDSLSAIKYTDLCIKHKLEFKESIGDYIDKCLPLVKVYLLLIYSKT